MIGYRSPQTGAAGVMPAGAIVRYDWAGHEKWRTALPLTGDPRAAAAQKIALNVSADGRLIAAVEYRANVAPTRLLRWLDGKPLAPLNLPASGNDINAYALDNQRVLVMAEAPGDPGTAMLTRITPAWRQVRCRSRRR